MATLDFTPLFRSTIGFDRLENMLDAATRSGQSNGYPPYNIEAKDEDSYRITMAVAGFAIDDIDLSVEQNSLIVSGAGNDETDDATYLHHGIAGRSFERRFELADHIKVTGADLVNGLLHIELEREIPEAMKPRKIAISNTAIEHKAA